MSGEFFDRPFGPNGVGMNKSSWEMTNEGRPMPMPMHNDVYIQYYQTPAYPNVQMGNNFNDEMRMRRAGAPQSVQFQSNHALLGLPGGNSVDLIQQMQSQNGTPFDDGQLDPMLLAYEGGVNSDVDPNTMQQHGYRNEHHVIDDRIDHLLNMPNHAETWQSDPNMVSLDHESEFDKWMGEH